MISGDFFGSEECSFFLFPVFADGEGEPVYTTGTHQCSYFSHGSFSVDLRYLRGNFLLVTATRGDLAVYMMLIIISFLSIVMFVTLVFSQNQ